MTKDVPTDTFESIASEWLSRQTVGHCPLLGNHPDSPCASLVTGAIQGDIEAIQRLSGADNGCK